MLNDRISRMQKDINKRKNVSSRFLMHSNARQKILENFMSYALEDLLTSLEGCVTDSKWLLEIGQESSFDH